APWLVRRARERGPPLKGAPILPMLKKLKVGGEGGEILGSVLHRLTELSSITSFASLQRTKTATGGSGHWVTQRGLLASDESRQLSPIQATGIITLIFQSQIHRKPKYASTQGKIHAAAARALTKRADRAAASTAAPPAARQELGWRRSSRCGLLAYAPPISSQAAGAGTQLNGTYMDLGSLPQASLAHPDGKCPPHIELGVQAAAF
ncbi:hypothetical protein DMN91_010405, partial [Ooceraea biroi]